MNMDNCQNPRRWAIDLAWYQAMARSFSVMAHGSLCPRCARKYKRGNETEPQKLISSIRDCCSKEPGFINMRQPFLESLFRVLLTNGNEPLDTDELGRRLVEFRGSALPFPAEVLERLLAADSWYGIIPVEG